MGVPKSMEIVGVSYEDLESEVLNSIFLLCARLGHQSLIMDLVKYCYGLGVLKGVHTLRDARDRICKSIQKLKDSGLMLDGYSSDHFNLHVVVQDAALHLAHKERNVFTLRNDKLDDWPEEDELEKCTAISIYKSDIVDELPETLNCPQLRVFHIGSDDQSLKIPDEFFKGMKKLRVLILIRIHPPHLPSSIKCLSNLRMLCLERCVLDDLSHIGNLKKLRIFSLSGSKVKSLAAELGGLVKLQLLDISDFSIANVIPPNTISNMTGLEELYIRKSLTLMEVEGETNQSQNSVLSELKHLHQLKIIDMYIQSASVLPLNLFFDNLNDHKIVIGDRKMFSIGDFKIRNKYEASRSLALQLKVGTATNIHSLKVDVSECYSLEGIVVEEREVNTDKVEFPKLCSLTLQDLPSFTIFYTKKNILSMPEDHTEITLAEDNHMVAISLSLFREQVEIKNLESLKLSSLINVHKIWNDQSPSSFCFQNLIKFFTIT